MTARCFTVFGITSVLFLAQASWAEDATDEAKKLAESALELAKEKKHDEAITALKKAIALAPRNDQYLALASDNELRAGKYVDGAAHALEAVRLNDRVGAYYVLVAANAVGEQNIELAREYCERLLNHTPKDTPAATIKDAQTLYHLVVPKTYKVTWELDPSRGRANGTTLAVAMPKTDLVNQTTSYQLEGARAQRLVKGSVNDVLYVTPQGKTPLELITTITVKPYSFKKELARARERGSSTTLPQEARAYLGPCLSINPSSPALRKVVAEQKGKDSVETAANLLAWMKKHIEYKLGSASIGKLDFDSVDEILERGHAECRGYAMLFVALCRAAGIPARPIWGLARVTAGLDRRFGEVASHSWAEFYVPGCGWVPVDPQRPESLGFLPTNCMRISMDVKRSKSSMEDLPLYNLVSMNGGKVRIEELPVSAPASPQGATPGAQR